MSIAAKKRNKGRYIHPIPKSRECANCHIVFPNTTKYFFKRKSYWTTKDGVTKWKWSTRSLCKSCNGLLAAQKRRNKKIKEYGCSPENYRKTALAIMGEKHKTLIYKYPYAFENNRSHLQALWIIRNIRAGYIWQGEEQWKIYCLKRRHKARAKHLDLPEGYLLFKEVPEIEMKKIKMQREPIDAVLANRLKLRLEEAPKELIEVKRIICKINREINNQIYEQKENETVI